MATSKIIVSTSAAVTVDGPISAMEEKPEFILQDGKYARKSALIVGIGMAMETAKSCMKVESSYKLMPVPSVEAQEGIAEPHEKIIIAEEKPKRSGATNFKIKLD